MSRSCSRSVRCTSPVSKLLLLLLLLLTLMLTQPVCLVCITLVYAIMIMIMRMRMWSWLGRDVVGGRDQVVEFGMAVPRAWWVLL